MRIFKHTSLLFLPCAILSALADNVFIYPPDNGEVLYVPKGSTFTVQWNSSYNAMNLRVFQVQSDGSYDYNTILSDVTNTADAGSYAYVANNLDENTGSMHFEITMSSNGQSIDPFNSGYFYVTNGTAISTSGAPTSTDSATSAASSTSTAVATTSSTSPSSVSATVTPTASSSSSPSSASGAMKLGLGLGLGLGIPLVLLLASPLGLTLLRRRKRYGSIKSQSPSENEMHQTGMSSTSYKDELRHLVHEVDGQHGMYEAPSEAAREAIGSDVRHEAPSEGAHEVASSEVRYEMSAEKEKV